MGFEQAIEMLTESFSKLNNNGYDFNVMLYGSAGRGEFVPGWSDLDVLVLTDEDITIPRSNYEVISKIHKDVATKTGVNLDITTIDTGILRAKEGRFSTFFKYWKTHFENSGICLVGENLVYLFPELTSCEEMESRIGFNLSSIRRHAVRIDYSREYDKSFFDFGTQYAIKSLKTYLRNAICYLEGEWIENYSEVNKVCMKRFGDIKDIGFLEKISETPHQWKELSDDEKIDLLHESLQLRQNILKAIVEE